MIEPELPCAGAAEGAPEIPPELSPKISPEFASVAASVQPILAPSLDDVAALTPASDYAAFIAPQVDALVRNAALKKLFTDPHFNTPDGLDVCVAADGENERSPQARQKQIQRARALGLLDDELADQDQPVADRPKAAAALRDTSSAHEDTDLRLQPHDAAGRQGPGPGAAPGTGRGG